MQQCSRVAQRRQTSWFVDLWGRQLDAVESQDFAKVDTEIDWVIKRKLFQRYRDRYLNCGRPPRFCRRVGVRPPAPAALPGTPQARGESIHPLE
ncbi:proteasome accessory factor PafA2 family protein, partial [Mycobacterium tuberculosis]